MRRYVVYYRLENRRTIRLLTSQATHLQMDGKAFLPLLVFMVTRSVLFRENINTKGCSLIGVRRYSKDAIVREKTGRRTAPMVTGKEDGGGISGEVRKER